MADKWLSASWAVFDNAEGLRMFPVVSGAVLVPNNTAIVVFMDLDASTRVWWLGRPGGGGSFCTPLHEMQAAYPGRPPPKWIASGRDFTFHVTPGNDPPNMDARSCPT